jgi:putative DNA primase/helicase
MSEQAFVQAIAEAGLEPPGHIVADGRLHRFSTNGNAADAAGWYVFHGEAGAFGDWRSGVNQKWSARGKRRMSWLDAELIRQQQDRRRTEQFRDTRVNQQQAAKRAAIAWQLATPAPENHAYLVRKQVSPHGIGVLGSEYRDAPRPVRGAGNLLVIPGRDADGRVRTVQYINEAGGKAYQRGARWPGAFYQIGEPAGRVWITEGFATAATLHQETGECVLVAFDTNGLHPVVEHVRVAAPGARITIMADDDWQTPGNPGLAAAFAARAKTSAAVEVLKPDFSGLDRGPKDTDYNDAAVLRRRAG